MQRLQSVRSIEDLDLGQLRALLRDFRWIRFRPGDEADFRAVYHRNLVPVVRAALVLAAGLMVLLSAVDWMLLPEETARSATGVRLTLALPAVAIVYGVTYLRNAGGPAYPPIAVAFSLVAGTAVLQTALRETAATGQHLAEFMGVIIYLYLFLGLRLKWALWATVPLTLAFGIGMAVLGEDPRTLAYSTIYLVFANVLGAAGCYLIEAMYRREYLEGRLLHALVGRDALTRIHNRRMFDDHFSRVWGQAGREKKRVGLILADIDHFKAFNDHYGHQEGDQTLAGVAQCLKACARRPLDFVARYGGEEFVLVLYDPERGYTETLCERIHNEVAALEIPHARSPLSGRVTVSLGAAVLRPVVDSEPEDGLRIADEALYRAKAAGRDRTVVVESEAALEQTDFFESEEWERHRAGGSPA